MIIGIDGNEANLESRVGVHQYAFEILWGIYKLKNSWKNKHKVVVYLKKQPRKDLPPGNESWQYKVLPGSGVWIITKLTPYLLLSKEKPDVFFAPSHYLPPLTALPSVCTIHDLGYLEFSGQFRKYDFWQLKYWSAISIFISKYIIAVSKSTKKDIVRHYPSASKKTLVTHHGYDKKRFNPKISSTFVRRAKKKYSIGKDYVLFIGTLKPSKNLEGLLEAWKTVLKNFPDISLVIAGKKGWLYKTVFEKVEELNLGQSVILTGYISEKEKPALIKGAEAFVLPSFWEGFGMDVLNAMACGTPVVVSRIASLPEVAGKAGIYINPYRIESIAEGIKKVLEMPEKEYNKLVSAGLEQVKKFSWEKTARETMEILEKVVS